MRLPVTYVWTPDPVGLGEDGPTPGPVERLASPRAPRTHRGPVPVPSVRVRVTVEAGTGPAWHRFAGDAGRIVPLGCFGASADAGTLFAEYGFTAENVAAAARESVAAARG